MTARSLARAGLVGLCLAALVSCDEGTGIGEKNFQKQYGIARDALERGRYTQAAQAYAQLIPKAGPLAPRLKLEYAHTQLRAGHYDKASQLAQALAQSDDKTLRSAALAVYGTAEHELGAAALQNGDQTTGKRHLKAAQSALGEMLKAHPEMDPLGAMAGRKASIDVRLKSL
ncbi:tetratricopeptide repeat protein [Roseovarius faecimaris]|nr:tetratricopeptide repeat protein [Roseovarius faecimaris]